MGEYCPYCPTDGGRCGVCSPDLSPASTRGDETILLVQTVDGSWYLGAEVEGDEKAVIRMCRVTAVKAVPPGDGMKAVGLPDVALAVSIVYHIWSAPSRKEVLDMARGDGVRQFLDLLEG